MNRSVMLTFVVCGTVLIILPLVLNAVIMLSLDSPSGLIHYRTYGLLPGAMRWIAPVIGVGMLVLAGIAYLHAPRRPEDSQNG